MIVIGLMSGTSADGIDAAVVAIDGAPPNLRWRLLDHRTTAHPPELRAEILDCCSPAGGTVDRICRLDAALGRAFARAAAEAAEAAGIMLAQVDLIGSHGQTIWHAPQADPPATLQIGCAAVIAEQTGVSVVSDFRSRDMAAGGQGAPLVAAVDALLLTHPNRIRAAQNIGGIANLTYLPSGGIGAFAFDTGPGNLLIDDAVRRISGGEAQFDQDGRIAASGRIIAPLLAELLTDPYYRALPPKTTGREQFGAATGARIYARARALGLRDADLVATLTALTAHSIAGAYRSFLPQMPDEVIVSGGGSRNRTLMKLLRELLAPARLLTSDEIGIPSEAKEALAFAVLAYESWHGRPGNLPAATGARRPVVLGSLTPGHPASDHRPETTDRETGRPGDRQTGSLPATNEPDQGPSTIVHQPSSTGTELRNPATEQIDLLPTLDLLRLINAEDTGVPAAVAAELPSIAEAVDRIAERMHTGGRLVYAGAGTSGRLGALDAAECPPTYSTPPGMVISLIAGGTKALTHSIEGAEDDQALGASDIAKIALGPLDTLVGIAASGSTPYVLGALEEARRRGALTISLACSHPAPIADLAEIAITLLVGPEVITGSTRMKAGTAQKLVLNMISTGVMVRLGKTYGNLMVDLQASNDKLRRRARRIVAEATGLTIEQASARLDSCDGEVKTAVVAELMDLTPDQARLRLAAAGGVVRRALLLTSDP